MWKDSAAEQCGSALENLAPGANHLSAFLRPRSLAVNSPSTFRPGVPMVADDTPSRRAFDEEARDGLLRVDFAGAGWKLEHFSRVERIRNAQRLAD